MLGFDWSVPRWKPDGPAALARAAAAVRRTCGPTRVGLRHKGEHLIKAMCPPNYDSMAEAVDAVVADKFGPTASTPTRPSSRASTGASSAHRYLAEASNYAADVIACTRDICTYIYETHGRFPAHCDTIHVPGVWLQAHHVENAYYEALLRARPDGRARGA